MFHRAGSTRATMSEVRLKISARVASSIFAAKVCERLGSCVTMAATTSRVSMSCGSLSAVSTGMMRRFSRCATPLGVKDSGSNAARARFAASVFDRNVAPSTKASKTFGSRRSPSGRSGARSARTRRMATAIAVSIRRGGMCRSASSGPSASPNVNRPRAICARRAATFDGVISSRGSASIGTTAKRASNANVMAGAGLRRRAKHPRAMTTAS